MLRSGEWVRERRARESLERGGVSPEGASSPRARRSFARGASSPRARWSFARGGVHPSSEAEFRQYGVVSLEQTGVSPEGCWG
jgi:hypothetical protein